MQFVCILQTKPNFIFTAGLGWNRQTNRDRVPDIFNDFQ